MKRHFFLRLAASASILAGIAMPAQSSIFDKDDRQYASPVAGSPYSPIGRVTVGSLIRLSVTGFLVDECHVLTSHAIFGHGPARLGERAKFEVGIGTRQHAVSKGTVVAGGSLEEFHSGQKFYENAGGDWILLRLDQCLGATVGHVILKAGPFSPYEFNNLKSAGYPMHRNADRGLTIDPSCRVLSGTDRFWNNDCALVRGDNGDPIFRLTNSGSQAEVYAMQAYGWWPPEPIPLTAGLENSAIPMSLIVPMIRPYLSVPVPVSGAR